MTSVYVLIDGLAAAAADDDDAGITKSNIIQSVDNKCI